MPVNIYLQPNFSGGGDLYTVFSYVPPVSGFTPWTPSAGPVIYLSDSIGSDSYNGLSGTVDGGGVGPKKTINAALDVSTGGSHVLFRRGDTFPNCEISAVRTKSGTAENYTIFGSYGDSPLRPVLEVAGSETDKFIWHTDNTVREYLRYDGLFLNNYVYDHLDPRFDYSNPVYSPAAITFFGGTSNVIFEDNVFNYTEFVADDFGGTRCHNFTFNRNIWTGAYKDGTSVTQFSRPSNMYINDSDYFTFTDNVIDMGGWSRFAPNCGGSQYSHNIYFQSGNSDTFVCERNIITRGASHGIHGRAGGLFNNNLYARNSVGQEIGYKDPKLPSDAFGYIDNAVVSEGESQFKGATDFDIEQHNDQKTGAVWGAKVSSNSIIVGADIRARNCVVSQLSPEFIIPNSLVTQNPVLEGLDLNGTGPIEDCLVLNWDSPTQGDNPEYLDQKRTVPTYYSKLDGDGDLDDLQSSGYLPAPAQVGYDNFDSFMNIVTRRQLGQWRDDLSAGAINNYIREGVNKSPIPF